jgi:hypothetical protein
VGLSAFDVMNRTTKLRITAKGRNMVRVYLLTRETPSINKVRKRSKRQPSTIPGMSRKNLLSEMMVRV